jgi:hypothetical protein
MREKIFLMILMLVVASLIVNKGSAYSQVMLYVDPLKSNVSVGSTFTVSIKLLYGLDIFVEQFYLNWYAPALNVTGYTEGDFLSQGISGKTRPVFKVYNESGLLEFWNVRLGPTVGGVTGSGTIATITFLVKSSTSTGLYLYNAHLGNELGQEVAIGFIKDGYVNVTPPTFHVAPSFISDPTLKPGGAQDHFTVNLTLTDVVNATGFAFNLYYNSTLLNATQLSIVPFLEQPFTNTTSIDNAAGSIYINVASSASTGATGSGTVANVTFKVLTIGETYLRLDVIQLRDSLANLGSPPFQHRSPTEDGYFSNIPAGHDVKVTKITALPTTLNAGDTVHINATIIDLGAFNETVYATVLYGANLIENRTGIDISSLESKILQFTWNTAGVAAGVYAITVRVGGVTNETNASHNVLVFSPITLDAPPSSNLYLYIGAGVAVAAVVILLALYFLRFRKPKSKAGKA